MAELGRPVHAATVDRPRPSADNAAGAAWEPCGGGMWTRLMLAGLLAAVVVWPTAVAALSAEECDQIDIHFKGLPGAASPRCDIGSIGGGGDRGSAKTEMIQVIDSRFVFVVSHAAVGQRSYLRRLTVNEMLRNYGAFASIDDVGEEAESGEFSVRRFNGKFSDGARTACFGFARYSGHVSHTTGYRHLINGFYCDLDESSPSDSRIDEVLGSLEYSF
jgi:hypothetical protein